MMEENYRLFSLIVAQAQNCIFNKRQRKRIDDAILQGITDRVKKRQKRERIVGYLDVTDRYLHDDFKAHFRMSRTTMELLINLIGDHYKRPEAHRGRPQESIKVQCLIAIWVLANQESYR